MKWRYEFAAPCDGDSKHIMVLYPKNIVDDDDVRVKLFHEMMAPNAVRVTVAAVNKDGTVDQLPLHGAVGRGKWARTAGFDDDDRQIECVIVTYDETRHAVDMHSTVVVAPLLTEESLSTGVMLWSPQDDSFDTESVREFCFGVSKVRSDAYSCLTSPKVASMVHPRLYTKKIKIEAFGRDAASMVFFNVPCSVHFDGRDTFVELEDYVCVRDLDMQAKCTVPCDIQATAVCVFKSE